MIYLNKILPIFVSPIFLIIVLLMLAIWRRWTWPIVVAAVGLWLASMPVVGDTLLSKLQSGMVRKTIASLPKADAIVVLSGTLSTVRGEHGYVTEWHDADRFFGGVKLLKAGKSDKLIFTRGQFPWAKNSRPEGEVFKEKALEMSVPETAIQLTDLVANTQEEAVEVSKMMNIENKNGVLLVTSAFHMPRAKRIFEAQGLKVTTFPVDFFRDPGGLTPMSFLPSAAALAHTSLFTREMLGRLYYRLRT